MQERLSIIYVGDSEADEFAIRMLKGVAFTFRVTNEDSEAITKTSADYWIAGQVDPSQHLYKVILKFTQCR